MRHGTYLDRGGGSVASSQQRSCHGSHFRIVSGVDVDSNHDTAVVVDTVEALLRPETRETQLAVVQGTHPPPWLLTLDGAAKRRGPAAGPAR